MKDFSELSGRDRSLEIVRWLAVLPVALLSQFVVLWVASGLYSLTSQIPLLPRLVREFPVTAAMVIAGSLTAPRFSTVSAFVLTAFLIILSVAMHLVLPSRIGTANWLDATFAVTGAISGAAYICCRKPEQPLPETE